ncbi:hypothetical protein [Arthrobacter sp. HLT1-21]
MRNPPYTGPSDTNDFDDMDPDQAQELLRSYRMLGDCFEDEPAEDLFGRGWLMESPVDLLESKGIACRRAERELAAAVALARYKGTSWRDIAAAIGMTPEAVVFKFGS